MKTIVHRGHTIKLYDSIQEMPAYRFQLFNLHLYIDSGIGSDVDAFAGKLSTIVALIKENPGAAITEIKNLNTHVQLAVSNINPKNNAFAALIHSIDGVVLTDEELAEGSIGEVVKRYSKIGISYITVKETAFGVKKKLRKKLTLFFKTLFLRKQKNFMPA